MPGSSRVALARDNPANSGTRAGNSVERMVGDTGLEPVTFGLGRRPSIAEIPGENAVRGSVVGDSRSFAALHNAALDLLRDQSMAHAPLTIFALAAAVLLLVMLRT